MILLKQWLKFPPVWVTLLLVMAVLVWQVWNLGAAPQRLSPALRELVAQGESKLDVAVQVNFKLEAFHLNYFQGRGRVAGVQDQQILLKDITAGEVQTIARNYWVSKILLANEID